MRIDLLLVSLSFEVRVGRRLELGSADQGVEVVPLAAPEAFGAGGGVDFLRSGHGASGFSFDALGDGVAAYLARLHTCLLALLAVVGLQPSASSRQLSDPQVSEYVYFRPWKRPWQPSWRISNR